MWSLCNRYLQVRTVIKRVSYMAGDKNISILYMSEYRTSDLQFSLLTHALVLKKRMQ